MLDPALPAVPFPPPIPRIKTATNLDQTFYFNRMHTHFSHIHTEPEPLAPPDPDQTMKISVEFSKCEKNLSVEFGDQVVKLIPE